MTISIEHQPLQMRFRTLLSLILGSMLAGGASAGWSAGPVKVKNINFMTQGYVIFYFEGARGPVPACATERYRFALNVSTPGGRAQLAGLLTAYTTGKSINVYGTGDCSYWADTESVDFFHTID